ncbi:MAG: hypothetical protein IPJ13_23170 [Saprospiraceae bacterium]|nr:hypothetical protein [Saprospiraceae bacterium]
MPLLHILPKFDTIETLLLDSFINASGYKLYRYTYGKKINEKEIQTHHSSPGQ